MLASVITPGWARSEPVGRRATRLRHGRWRLAGAIVTLFITVALVVEAAPLPHGDRDEEAVSALREGPPCLALSSNGVARNLVPVPPETRIGALPPQPESAADESNRLRSLGGRAPPRVPSGHRKQPERRARTSAADDAH